MIKGLFSDKPLLMAFGVLVLIIVALQFAPDWVHDYLRIVYE
jgi:hypothetical protein